MTKSSKYVCSRCNNSFATRQSLWNHKQRCRALRYDEQNEGRCYIDNNNARTIIDVAASKLFVKGKSEKNNHIVMKSFILTATNLKMVNPRHWRH